MVRSGASQPQPSLPASALPQPAFDQPFLAIHLPTSVSSLIGQGNRSRPRRARITQRRRLLQDGAVRSLRVWRCDRVSGARIHLHGAGRASGAPHVERGRELFLSCMRWQRLPSGLHLAWTYVALVKCVVCKWFVPQPGTRLDVILTAGFMTRLIHTPSTRPVTRQGAWATRPIPAALAGGGGGGEVVEDSGCDR